MASRQIIEIDQDLCNGCGECATGCPEGALRIIDGKARLVGESLCDGLGACIGNCPLGAIKVTVRDAEGYDERKVMEGIARQGPDVLRAHLEHLDHHGQDLYIRQALAWLAEKGLAAPEGFATRAPASGPAQARMAAPATPGGMKLRVHSGGGCPGSAARLMDVRPAAAESAASAFPERPSEESRLAQWPIQLHLANPRSGHFAGADVLVAADCTAFSMGSFHKDLLDGRKLLIACPKLDSGREIYVDKLAAIMDQARSLSLAVMEVPCCSGLVKLAAEARERCSRKLPLETLVIGIEGGFVARTVH